MDGHRLAHAVIADFLGRNGYQDVLSAFERETMSVGWKPAGDASIAGSNTPQGSIPILEELIEAHQSNKSASIQHDAVTRGKDSNYQDPTGLVLKGAPTIPFRITCTHGDLHAGNILSLAKVDLPTRAFSTTTAAYETRVQKVLCSTSADKNIILSDPSSGEMIDILEGGTGPSSADLHSAAILCVAQNPNRALSRELVSCGMDTKVILWDLLHRKPKQVLRHHTKFVVRCAFSQDGMYLATCSYDKTVRIYRRKGSTDLAWLGRAHDDNSDDEDEEDDSDTVPLIDTSFELVHTVNTSNNPESIVFVRGALAPDANDSGTYAENQTGQGADSAMETTSSKRTRSWLVYTTRSDCFVHYIAMPQDAHSDGPGIADVNLQLRDTSISQSSPVSGAPFAVPDYTELAFNTNVNRLDFHVSYSLLSVTLHPLGQHIAIQTGDHSIPSTGYAPASSAMSRILLMPILSSRRTATLWTGIVSSGYAANRHAWLPDGSAAWLTSEEGILRLIDTHGKIRASIGAHGAAASSSSSAADRQPSDNAMHTQTTWSRGGNTIVKDIVVLDDRGSVASCGFDRTIRILEREDQVSVA